MSASSRPCSPRRLFGRRLFACASMFALGASALGQGTGDYDCDLPVSGPDLIVGSINDICEWGAIGGTSAYSIGATSCNVGDEAMDFSGDGIHHPVIAQNLYRLEDGRLEQLGQSWIKHAFASAEENLCCDCQSPGSGLLIGVGCADTYGACQNGVQGPIVYFGATVSGLGSRADVHPTTGAFTWPYPSFGQTGDTLYKRLQVENADLDPAQHPGAQYFAEVQYVGPDEGGVALTHNNSSYAPVTVGAFDGETYNLGISGGTLDTSPAIQAWQDQDPGVALETVDDAAGGRFYVASRASDNGDGTWRYEYALYNQNSALPARSFRLALESGVNLSGVGFHDVDCHSGDPFDNTDWTPTVSAAQVEWAGGVDVNANAVRWGTMYNFWFSADRAPAPGRVSLGLLGSADSLHVDGMWMPCGAVSYCSALAHSAGGPASIGFSGSASVAANDLVLRAEDSVPGAPGLFFYGATRIQVPFGGGFRCVGGMTFRLNPPLAADGSGSALRPLDYGLPPLNAGSGMVEAGGTWNFQWWFRDAMGADGSGFNLSDGLSVTFCP